MAATYVVSGLGRQRSSSRGHELAKNLLDGRLTTCLA
jgi:hypothetical protein